MDKCTIPDLCMEEALEDVYFLKKKKQVEWNTDFQNRKRTRGYPRAEFLLHTLDYSSEYQPGKNGVCLSMALTSSAWYSLNADLEF